MLIDERAELQFLQGAEDGGDVAMGTRADDVECMGQGSADGSGSLQNGAEGVDLSLRPMGEVGESAVVDFAVETEAFAEEDGGRGFAIGYGGNVHVYTIQ
jgi:hypothetical protein